MSGIKNKSKLIYDTIHHYMKLSPLCIQIIDTSIFKRLKNLKQLGIACEVFPGATHTRFEHSIGVCYLAGKMIRSIAKHQPTLNITKRDIELIEIAALCHDLGHGPFSHLFDNYVLSKLDINNKSYIEHENRSGMLLEHMVEMYNIPITSSEIEQIKRYIHPLPEDTGFMYQIVANMVNGIDVDKFDYLKRDSYNIGLEYSYDSSRIIKEARVIDGDICYPVKLAHQIYNLYHVRYRLNKEIFQHPALKSIDFMIADVLLLLNTIPKYVNFAKDIETIEFAKYTDSIIDSVKYFQEDGLTSEELQNLKEAKKLIRRIEDRDLYKYIGDYTEIINSKTILKIQEKMSKKLNCSKEDVIVDMFKLGYGSLGIDPLSKIWFYTYGDPDKKIRLDRHAVSRLLPTEYEECIIQVFVKNYKINSI